MDNPSHILYFVYQLYRIYLSINMDKLQLLVSQVQLLIERNKNDLPALLVTTAVAIGLTYAVQKFLVMRAFLKRLPPGNPWIDKTWSFLYNTRTDYTPFNFLREEMKKNGNSPIFTMRVFGMPTIVISGGDNFRRLLMKDFVHTATMLPDFLLDLLGQHSIGLINDKSRHKGIRMVWLRHTNPQAVAENFTKGFHATAKKYLARWTDQGTVQFTSEVKFMSFNNILNNILGTKMEEERALKIKDALETLDKGLWLALPFKFPGTTFYNALQAKKFIYAEMDAVYDQFRLDLQRKAQDPGYQYTHTLLHSFLEFRFPGDGSPMTKDELLDNALSVFIGGTNTTTVTSSLLLALLDLRPDVFARVKEEQRRIVAQHGEEITKEAYDAMELTHACIKETLRLATPVPAVMRKALEDFEFEGFLIPKGYTVMPSMDLTNCRDPATWKQGDLDFSQCSFHPNSYDPERWLHPDTRPTSFPFSSGPHQCAGMQLSLRFLTIFLATFARDYSFEVLDKSKEFSPAMFVRLKTPLPMRINRDTRP